MSLDVSVLARRWTDDELDGLDDSYRYEIVDGHLLVSPRPAAAHIRANSRLIRALQAALPPEFDVWTEPTLRLATSTRSPDLVVVRPSEIGDEVVTFTPEQILLAVEIVSPSSVGEDKLRKPAEYAAAGIPAYWFVDPGSPSLITAFTLVDGVYRLASGPSPRAELPWPVDLS